MCSYNKRRIVKAAAAAAMLLSAAGLTGCRIQTPSAGRPGTGQTSTEQGTRTGQTIGQTDAGQASTEQDARTGQFIGQTDAGQTARTGLAGADPSASVSDVGFYFDTVVELRLNGTDDHTLIDGCFRLMADYESLLSRTREGSDVWRINHSSGQSVTVSEDTTALLALAEHYYELSDGAFDVTVAPYTMLWDFTDNPGTVPDESALAAARTHVGFPLLHLDGQTVRLDDPEAAVDLGGIAKGYIADRLRDYLTENGITSGYINLGGNVLTVGTKPGNVPWNIGIRKPFGDASDLIRTVEVEDSSVVTSGTYERFFEKDGVLYHHILDPQTGYPVRNGLQSVTILSHSSADGDALSTACFVLGRERGLELIESLDGIEAMFIEDGGAVYCSQGFPAQS